MEAKSKHTEGPWLTNGIESPVTGLITVYARPFGLGDIAEVHGEANAVLIAAAPDMLAVLQLVLNSDMAMREEDEGAVSPTLEYVRAAILKATGGAT